MKRIVPVSGGKDSQLVLQLILDRWPRTDIVAVHQFTGFDHPDTLAHMQWMEKFYDVPIQYTHSVKYKDMEGFLRGARYFPNNTARGCTQKLKQEPFRAWLRHNKYDHPGAATIYMGMRADESRARTSKYGQLDPNDVFTLGDISVFYNKAAGQIPTMLPIVDWTTAQVFKYLESIPGTLLNPLYKRGHSRVGCYPCLLARNSEWEAAAHDPHGRKNIKMLLDVEEEFIAEGNPRKYIKVHPVRDVRAYYERGEPMAPTADTECGQCSI